MNLMSRAGRLYRMYLKQIKGKSVANPAILEDFVAAVKYTDANYPYCPARAQIALAAIFSLDRTGEAAKIIDEMRRRFPKAMAIVDKKLEGEA